MDKTDKTHQESKGKPGKPHSFVFWRRELKKHRFFFFYHGSQKMLEFGRVEGLEFSWFGTHSLLTRGLKRYSSTLSLASTILWGPFRQPSPVSGFWVQEIHLLVQKSPKLNHGILMDFDHVILRSFCMVMAQDFTDVTDVEISGSSLSENLTIQAVRKGWWLHLAGESDHWWGGKSARWVPPFKKASKHV